MMDVQEKERTAPAPLDTLAGKLASSFSVASDVHRLHKSLMDTQPETARARTGAILSAFYSAAEKLKSREEEFKTRTRSADQGSTPDLKVNLRSPDHFAALRAFKGASADIIAMDSSIGSALIKAVEKKISAPAASSKPRA